MKRSRRDSLATLALLAGLSLLTVQAVAADVPKTGLPSCDPAEVGMNAAKLAQIPHRIRQFVEQKQISGAVTLVAKDGCVAALDAVGLADVEAGRPMRTDTLFRIASMTKPITATALMILAEEGKLSLDNPASKYIPEFESAALEDEPASRQITIRDLLTHTSGMVGSQRCEKTLEETVAMLAARPLGSQPGTKWEYSPGLTVCGRIIEVASGEPYDQFLRKRIFAPLAMDDTTFRPTPAQIARAARLYEPGPDENSIQPALHWLADDWAERAPNPSGGLFSTAADMARFYQMALNGGELDGKRIVSKASVDAMTHIHTGDLVTGFTPGNGWGLGWCVVREPQGVTEMLSPGTFGHGGAFGTQVWVDPARKMVFVLMIQRTKFGNSDGSDIRAAFQQLAVDALEK